MKKLTLGEAIASATTTAPAKVAPPKEQIDWQAKTDAEVWGSKAPGAALEKIRRLFQSICLYNDTVATGDGDAYGGLCQYLAVTSRHYRRVSPPRNWLLSALP